MEASVETAIVYKLCGEEFDVIADVNPSSKIAERLTYRSDGDEHRRRHHHDDERVFSGAEISSLVSAEGTRAGVVLEDGADGGPIVRLAVILPLVDSPQKGPFDVSVAAVVATARPGAVRPGPQQSFEATTMKGTVSLRSAGREEGPVGD